MSQNANSTGKSSRIDRLFLGREVREDFSFTGEVAAVFDDMLLRSVPGYSQVAEATAQLLQRRLGERACIYDLGCSVGTMLCFLADRLAARHFRYVGVDLAPAMLERARARAAEANADIRFLEGDLASCPLDGADAVLCQYTLQFLRPVARQALVERIFAALPAGGIFILSKKTIAEAPTLNRDFIAIYHDFKRANGYSDMEIAAKREALENVLVPFSAAENRALLNNAGFAEVECFFTWFNFSSFVALKK